MEIWLFAAQLSWHIFLCQDSLSRTLGINVSNVARDMSPFKFETFFEDKQFFGMPLNLLQEVRWFSQQVSLLVTGRRSSVAQEVSLLFSSQALALFFTGSSVGLQRRFRSISQELLVKSSSWTKI